MNIIFRLLFALSLGASAVSAAATDTYTNPIIHADYSDPDVVRTGTDYWMVASSFHAMPGIPVLHSRNLVDWELAGHVYGSLPSAKYDRPVHGEGSWAPAIRCYDGVYYVYFCTPEDGLFVATASDPRGPWELRQMADVAKWEDPCPFRDDDGSRWLLHSLHRGGPAILHRLSDDGMRLLDDGVTVYCDTVANPTLEGVKMMKRDGWYYILAPAGGVGEGWQTVLRSRSIYGPYESRRVLEQGSTDVNGPHQGALVDTPDGSEWWFIHFQQHGIHGRITHLQPARFTPDGWIEMGDGGEPVLSHRRPAIADDGPQLSIATSDDFSVPALGLQWQWQGNPKTDWYSLTERPGWMRLRAVSCPSEKGNLYYAPNLLLQKLPADEFTVTTVVEPHFTDSLARAGLVTMGKEYSYIAVSNDSIMVVTGRGDKRFPVALRTEAAVRNQSPRMWLRATYGDYDRVTYSYSADGERFTQLGEPLRVSPGVWVGAKTGIFALTPSVVPSASTADFDRFEVSEQR